MVVGVGVDVASTTACKCCW